jgi:hypothetical protein
MAGLVPAIDVDARYIGVRKHAVLRTAMPGLAGGQTDGKAAKRAAG